MPSKLFIKTETEDFYIQIEFQPKGFETSCVFVDKVPEWIVKSKIGRSSLHPCIIDSATELGKSYNVRLHDPIEYWAV